MFWRGDIALDFGDFLVEPSAAVIGFGDVDGAPAGCGGRDEDATGWSAADACFLSKGVKVRSSS